MEEYKYGHENQVVPVLDKTMEQQPRAGNKYRRSCLTCERWLPMCSEDTFDPIPIPMCSQSERMR